MIKTIKNLRSPKSEEGFTLVELMIVVVIIGILAAIAIPVFANQQKAASYANVKSDIKSVVTMATVNKTKTGKFPQTCEEWQAVVPPGWKGKTTAAIGATTSDDGLHLWIEGQPAGMTSGGGLTLEEGDSLTAVYDSAKGNGVMSRTEYATKYHPDRVNQGHGLHKAAGYTKAGWRVGDATCGAWS